MSDSYGYDEGFQLRLLAAVVRKPKEMFGLVSSEYFTNPVQIDIAGVALAVRETIETKHSVLTKSTLTAMMRDFLSEKKKDLWPMYRRAIKKIYKLKLSDLPLLRNEALSFAKHMKYKAAIVACEKDVSNRKYDRVHVRINELKRIGNNDNPGIRYWDNPTDESRWKEDRYGIIPTRYFKLLDKAMGGGLGAGELAIIQASGKAGKSLLLGRIAAGAMWRGKNAAIASGELSEFKYRKRIDAMLTGIPYAHLSTRQDEKKAGTKAQMAVTQKRCQGQLAIKEFPSGKSKIEEIERWLIQMEEYDGFKADVLLVDYLALFSPNERYEEKRLNLGQAAVDLRGLAMERKIGCWTAAQVNRAGLDKPMIGPADLAEDISLFFTADFLIAICQTAKERGTAEQQREGKVQKARLILAAARDVASGAVIKVDVKRNIFEMRETGYGSYEDGREK